MKTLVLSTCLAFVNCCLFYCGRSMSQQLVLRLSYILLLRRKEVFNKSFFLLPFIVGLSLSKEHFLRLELNSGSCHQKTLQQNTPLSHAQQIEFICIHATRTQKCLFCNVYVDSSSVRFRISLWLWHSSFPLERLASLALESQQYKRFN